MVSTAEAKYSALLEIGNCGMLVILPDHSPMALHEQNGGYSTLFNEDEEELYLVTPDGRIMDDDTLLCTFDEVEAPGTLVPWLKHGEGEEAGQIVPAYPTR